MSKRQTFEDRWFQIKSSLEILYSRYTHFGFFWVVSRIAKRLTYYFGWFLLLPLTITLHAAGFRRVAVYTDRIGHLVVEIDSFLKERALGRIRPNRYFILSLPHRVSNPCLLHDYWGKLIPVIRQPHLVRCLDVMTSRGPFMRYCVKHVVLTEGNTSPLYELYASWKRPPLLDLQPRHQERGYDALKRLGLPDNAWFVCIHTREPGYSPVDEIHMDFRNADPKNLIPAIHEIIARGGWCIRMGDAKTEALPLIKGLIDYPRSSEKSDWMDIFLCGACRIFLGANSGLHFVANAFGRPVVLANMVPAGVLPPCPGDLGIPKLLRLAENGHILSFAEALSSPSANYQLSTAFKKDGLDVIENDAEDIRDLVSEMLERLKGTWTSEAEDEILQNRYQAYLKPSHFSYGAASHIATSFLRKHRNLIAS